MGGGGGGMAPLPGGHTAESGCHVFAPSAKTPSMSPILNAGDPKDTNDLTEGTQLRRGAQEDSPDRELNSQKAPASGPAAVAIRVHPWLIPDCTFRLSAPARCRIAPRPV